LLASTDPHATRRAGLGVVWRIPDAAMLEMLGYLGATELVSFMGTSKAAYVFANHVDLWRDVTLRRWSSHLVYIATWRDTYARAALAASGRTHDVQNFRPHVPIRLTNIFSDVLHRTWVCHTCEWESSCPGFFVHSDVPRRDAADLSVDAFVAEYEMANRPVIIRGAVDHWGAMRRWTPEYLAAACGDRQFRATSATAPVAAQFTMAEYFAYASQAQEEAALYLFDRDFHAVAGLGSDYDIPSYFRPGPPRRAVPAATGTATGSRDGESCPGDERGYATDLFRVFGETARPDYRWLIAGPKRSGSIFHIDPNMTNAWNVCVKGRKKWIFYPPSVCPPGVERSPDGADVAVPLSTGEWLLSFWPAHMEARRHPDPKKRPLEAIVEEGEVIFVPHGYWHMVVNVDDCIAVTHNYVSSANLADVLRFLRDKPEQISGVRDRAEMGAVQPEDMHGSFLAQLVATGALSEDAVARADAESRAPRASLVPKRPRRVGTAGMAVDKRRKGGALAECDEGTTTDCSSTSTAPGPPSRAPTAAPENFSFSFF